VRATLPPEIAVRVCHDQPEWVRRSVRGFMKSLLEGILLVMLVITLGMGGREALVVAGVIPLSVGGRSWALSPRLQPRDGHHRRPHRRPRSPRRRRRGRHGERSDPARQGPLGAAGLVFGTARVFWANNGTTAVAISSFLPLFAMSGDVGKYIKGCPRR